MQGQQQVQDIQLVTPPGPLTPPPHPQQFEESCGLSLCQKFNGSQTDASTPKGFLWDIFCTTPSTLYSWLTPCLHVNLCYVNNTDYISWPECDVLMLSQNVDKSISDSSIFIFIFIECVNAIWFKFPYLQHYFSLEQYFFGGFLH